MDERPEIFEIMSLREEEELDVDPEEATTQENNNPNGPDETKDGDQNGNEETQLKLGDGEAVEESAMVDVEDMESSASEEGDVSSLISTAIDSDQAQMQSAYSARFASPNSKEYDQGEEQNSYETIYTTSEQKTFSHYQMQPTYTSNGTDHVFKGGLLVNGTAVTEVNSKLLPKKYKCAMCTYKSSYKSDLNRHVRKHLSSTFHCEICNMPFKTSGNLEYHKRKNHANYIPGKDMKPVKHQCHLCSYSSIYKHDLKRHILIHDRAEYNCNLCKRPFTSEGRLLHHKRNSHKLHCVQLIDEPKQEDEQYVYDGNVNCPVDSKDGNAGDEVARNDQEVDPGIQITDVSGGCQTDAAPQTQSGMTIPIVNHQNSMIKQVQCPLCKKAYGNTQMLKLHMRNVHKVAAMVSKEKSKSFYKMPPLKRSPEFFQNSKAPMVKQEADAIYAQASTRPPALVANNTKSLVAPTRSFTQQIDVTPDILFQPPSRGRYIRLVSDYEDFAAKPFACSLCFYRTNQVRELVAHAENHLTGCNSEPIPETARFENY